MSHPGILLIDYVDGTLGPDPRAEVESHLEGCATCREEVRLARAGKHAAGSLLAPAVPPDLAERAIEEATLATRERNPEVAAISSADRRRPNAPRWLAATAAAAVIIAVALIGPKLGQSPATVTEQAAGAEGGALALPSPSAVEIQHQNYTFGGLSATTQALRSTYTSFAAADAEAAANAAPAATLTAGPSTGRTVALSPGRVRPATDCLTRAFLHTDGTLVRVILAKYEGQPAYFGVYLVSPGAGLPPKELRLDVASVHGCTILAQSSAEI